jgi:hypothetical protein
MNTGPAKTTRRRKGLQAGFALIVTLLLLALLVLTVYALTTLTRIGTGLSANAVYRTQARQHALLGLDVAWGELQRAAGEDSAITGMAGITGITAGAGKPARQWCGVWGADGHFIRWLVSGVSSEVIPPLGGNDSIAVLSSGTLGADGNDKEHVRVLLEPVLVNNASGNATRQGSYAWWVGDEVVKLSAVIPAGEAPESGRQHAINELIAALDPMSANLARVLAYGQLAFVPDTPLTPGPLQSRFHVLGVTHRQPIGTSWLAGRLNVNSTASSYWRGIGATYNRLRPTTPLSLDLTTFGNRMRDNLALATSIGKAAGGPYQTVDAFLTSPLLAAALQGSGVTPEQFGDVMRAWLTTRSDTFRIRAYGEAANPADATRVEAEAWCEAIVQRVDSGLPGFGRRYMLLQFRWLGTEDI